MQEKASIVSLAVLSAILGLPVDAQSPSQDEAAFRDLYKELVEINTTRSVGSCTGS